MPDQPADPVDVPTPATGSEGPRRSRGRAVLIGGRVLAGVLALALLAAIGVGWTIRHRGEAAMARNEITGALFPDDPNLRPTTAVPGSSPAQPGDPATGTTGTTGTDAADQPVSPQEAAALPAENILILGLDTRGNGEGGVGPGTSQSDVIMLAHLHAGHRRITVLSVPRDTYVDAPSCLQWDNRTGKVSDTVFTSPYRQWKITNAYSVGGPQCTVKAVQELTGLRVDRIVAIQFNGFKAVVDALGGVTMTFDKPVVDGHQGVVIPQAGTQTIDGAQALKLVRSRTVVGDPRGDLGRIDRQRLLLLAILKKMTGTGLLTDPARLDSVVQTFAENSTSQNLGIDQLLSLASSLSGGAKVGFVTLPTVQDPTAEGLDVVTEKADPELTALATDQVPAGTR